MLILSCVQHDVSTISTCIDPQEVSFGDDVAPIVETNCAISGCHNGDNGSDRDWTNFQKFQDHATEVRRRITLPADDPDHMPASGSLTTAEIQTIICWVDQGAKDN